MSCAGAETAVSGKGVYDTLPAGWIVDADAVQVASSISISQSKVPPLSNSSC